MDIEHFQGAAPVDYQERVAIFRTYCCDKITAPSHITASTLKRNRSKLDHGPRQHNNNHNKLLTY
ncbi:hypothetical protein D4764_19G0000670 [Takifugu flavidus]|uniref:Uncharacterized protein n=1 Tax=Takifugu flavidus TaxID=433684 RepID=A0A5C6NNM6_9TELE|nr:hypothetical protein D4764_19G0000670 [Takifugu flavidus]